MQKTSKTEYATSKEISHIENVCTKGLNNIFMKTSLLRLLNLIFNEIQSVSNLNNVLKEVL